jgi:hypothetical protein
MDPGVRRDDDLGVSSKTPSAQKNVIPAEAGMTFFKLAAAC